MRDIASMYGAPSPSLLSRDPLGLDPRDDYTSQLEPSGSRPDDDEEEEVIQSPPPLGDPTGQDHISPMMKMSSPVVDGNALKAHNDNFDFAGRDVHNAEIAKLVGIPPPPPKAPPPQKSRRIKTPQARPQAEAVTTVTSFKENEEHGVEDESWIESNNGATPTIGVAASDSDDAHSSSKIDSEPLRERHSSLPRKSRDVVEERRQLALSIYESSHLVLDENEIFDHVSSFPPVGLTHQTFVDPSMVLRGEMQLSPTVRTSHGRSAKKRDISSSPSSEATKTHSNQTHDPPQTQSPSRSVLTKLSSPSRKNSKSTGSMEVVNNNKLDLKLAGFTLDPRKKREQLAERNVSRASSKEQRRNRTPSPRPDQTGQKDKKEKRGFFKKLFRGGRSSRDNSPAARNNDEERIVASDAAAYTQTATTQDSSPKVAATSHDFKAATETATVMEPPSARETSKLAEPSNDHHVQWQPAFGLASDSSKAPALKPALKSEGDRHYQGEPSITFTNETSKRSPKASMESPTANSNQYYLEEGDLGFVDVDETANNSNQTRASSSIVSPGSMKLKTFSQDPPDDEHGDPPMYSGPPLLSPSSHHLNGQCALEDESEQIRMDSVRSRIAEIYEGHSHPDSRPTIDGFPADISNDRLNHFFLQADDVSILSGPSFESLNKKKSFDPSPKNEKEDLEDPPQEERGPDMLGPIPTPAHVLNLLRVQIKGPTMDPAGASPVVKGSARGFAPERHAFGDPLGESPMGWQKPKYSSNDPLGSSPLNANQFSSTASELALSLLDDDDKKEILQIDGQNIPDPPLMDGYLSDESMAGETKVDVDKSYSSFMTYNTTDEEKKDEEFAMIQATVDMIDSKLSLANMNGNELSLGQVQTSVCSPGRSVSAVPGPEEHLKRSTESHPADETTPDVQHIMMTSNVTNDSVEMKEAQIRTPPRRKHKFSKKRSINNKTVSPCSKNDNSAFLEAPDPVERERLREGASDISATAALPKVHSNGGARDAEKGFGTDIEARGEIENSGFKSAPTSLSAMAKTSNEYLHETAKAEFSPRRFKKGSITDTSSDVEAQSEIKTSRFKSTSTSPTSEGKMSKASSQVAVAAKAQFLPQRLREGSSSAVEAQNEVDNPESKLALTSQYSAAKVFENSNRSMKASFSPRRFDKGHSADLETRSEIEKSGFKSAPSSPCSAAKKTLTVSTAAFTNAKAVAYLHRLHGEPSPRHTWHASKQKKGAAEKPIQRTLMAKASKRNAKKNVPVSMKKAPSPEEYCATNSHVEEIIKSLGHDDLAGQLESTSRSSNKNEELVSTPNPRTKHYVKNDPTKLFVPYSRFQGRRPTRKAALKPEILDTEPPLPDITPTRSLELIVPLGKISGLAVARGIELRRLKREDDIVNGRSERVIVTPRQKPTGGNRFNFVPADESEIKDPIRRAGRRLLSKAAIPIQSGARRFLAKRDAVNRMWALIQVQSYIRRWRCETYLQAHIHSATVVQAAFRSWRSRETLKDMHFCATLIQKIVRGYLAAVHAYDAIYYMCRLQALVRGYCVRRDLERKNDAATTIQSSFRQHFENRTKSATMIQKMYRGYFIYRTLKGMPHVVRSQALYRGFRARQEYSVARASTVTIQSVWRAFTARMEFQMVLVDVIIVQSVARRWSARRRVELIRHSVCTNAVTRFQATWRCYVMRQKFLRYVAARKVQATWRCQVTRAKHRRYVAARKVQARWRCHMMRQKHLRYVAARKIQGTWRCHVTRLQHRRYLAARKIQSMWRRFHAYTDYIFMIVDVLVVQRMVRQWLAIRKAKQLRKERSAILIQSVWRRRTEQVRLLYSLVHIIIVQSIARRYLSRSAVEAMKKEASHRSLRQIQAATSIQKIWRGFWSYSHYIIVQYEIARIQALVRAKLARESFNLKIGCVILIQATARGFLAKRVVKKNLINEVVVASKAQELRHRNSAKRIQFWWRIVLDWMKEKKAALTIERFFIFVKAEVDREICRRERKRLSKEKKRKKKFRDSEDRILENAWLKTVDESGTVASGVSSTCGSKKTRNSSRSKSAPRQYMPDGYRPAPVDINPRIQVSDVVKYRRGPVIDDSSYAQPPPQSVQLAPSGDFSVVSNITNPSVFHRMMPSTHQLKVSEQNSDNDLYRDFNGRSTNNDKQRMTTEDYIRKYGGLRTAPHRMANSTEVQPFFAEDESSRVTGNVRKQSSNGTPTTFTQSHTQATTTLSASAMEPSRRRRSTPITISLDQSTPRGAVDECSPRVPSTPRSNASSKNNISRSTPRAHSGSNRDSLPKYPPLTPTLANAHISRRGTAETENETFMSETTYSRASPRFQSKVKGRNNNSVMIMKTYADMVDGESVAEAHEVLLLGDDYGEV